MLRDWSSGDLFGLSQNAGMGWKPEEMVGPQYLILSTQGGVRAPDGTPIALGYHTGHWEVGLLGRGRRPRAQAIGRRSVRRLLLRSVRRPHAGHRRHVRQPAVSQRRRHDLPPPDSLAAHAPRSDRRGDLRQGIARDDDGPGRHARSAVRAGARRRDAAARARRRRRQDPNDRRTLRSRRDHAGRSRRPRLPRVRIARRRLPVPGHRGHVASRRRSARPVAAAFGARPQRPADLARHGSPQPRGH